MRGRAAAGPAAPNRATATLCPARIRATDRLREIGVDPRERNAKSFLVSNILSPFSQNFPHKFLSENRNRGYNPSRRRRLTMTREPASPSQRAAVRAQRRARRNERIARRENFFDLVASGYSCRQIAEAAKVSAATVRREIDRAIAERRLDAPERYVHVQVARLAKALRLADASIERGDLKAVGPLVRLVAALDRYHGLGRTSAQRAPAAADTPLPPAEAPPPALPAPPLGAHPRRVAARRRAADRRRGCGSGRSPGRVPGRPSRRELGRAFLPGPVRFIAMRAARENCELPTARRAIRLGRRLVGMTSMAAHARGPSRAEQNTNNFLTAYAGYGIVGHSRRMAPAAISRAID